MRTKPIAEGVRNRHSAFTSTTMVNYQPGNGTRYILTITNLLDPHPAAEAMDLGGCFLVCLVNQGTCMTLRQGGFLAPAYVAEKLKVGMGDAVILAEFLAQHCGRTAPDASLEGSYK